MSEMKNKNPQDDAENGDSQARREAIDAAIWLDRLVDGEIGDDEQRQLLLALESQPDGWRRCALTFIEAQTLRKDLQSVGNNSEVADDDGPRVPINVAAKQRGSNLANLRVRWFAMAACFAMAFVIGSFTRGRLNSNGSHEEHGPSLQEMQVATNVGHPQPATTATDHDASQVKPVGPNETPSGGQLASVTTDGTSEQTVEVPLVEASASDLERLVSQKKAVLSEAELKQIETSGRLVQQRRALYPVMLQDGRQAVVPVDLVEVRDTGGWQ